MFARQWLSKLSDQIAIAMELNNKLRAVDEVPTDLERERARERENERKRERARERERQRGRSPWPWSSTTSCALPTRSAL